jgi:hypothetical protein
LTKKRITQLSIVHGFMWVLSTDTLLFCLCISIMFTGWWSHWRFYRIPSNHRHCNNQGLHLWKEYCYRGKWIDKEKDYAAFHCAWLHVGLVCWHIAVLLVPCAPPLCLQYGGGAIRVNGGGFASSFTITNTTFKGNTAPHVSVLTRKSWGYSSQSIV